MSLSRPAAAADVRYQLSLSAGRDPATAAIEVPPESRLREIELSAGPEITRIRADGELRREGKQLRWRPGLRGGTLGYEVSLTRRRGSSVPATYDALATERFAIFRGEDAWPVRRTRKTKGTGIVAEVLVRAPPGWSVVTPYRQRGAGAQRVDNPFGRAARPVGWIISGDLGTRREVVAGVEFTVAAPRGQRTERLATIALLRWTAPRLFAQFRERPRYVSIVSAGAPMWLGALSAPNSIFVHGDRPLISENGTSTIVHELVHVLLTPMRTVRDHDWIDEGLAEYLSLRVLADSGTISPARFDAAIAEFRKWSRDLASLRTPHSSGPVTARAVVIFADLDSELRQRTTGRRDLFDFARRLNAETGAIDVSTMRRIAREIGGDDVQAFAADRLPGFP